jgi:hypothetical protein
MGERDAAFALGKKGWVCVEGPFGSEAHRLNAPGFDGIFYHPGKKQTLLLDNKASGGTGRIRGASALTDNYRQNLDVSIKRIEAQGDFRYRQEVLRDLHAARDAATQGKPQPKSVIRGVSNAGGYHRGVSTKAKEQGLDFVSTVPDGVIQARKQDIARATGKGVRAGRPMTVPEPPKPAAGTSTAARIASQKSVLRQAGKSVASTHGPSRRH